MGDARGDSIVGSSGNTVKNDLYRDMVGNRGTVGDIATDIQSLCRVEGIQEGWTQEGGLGASRGNRESDLGNLGRSLTGGKDEEATGRNSCAVGAKVGW